MLSDRPPLDLYTEEGELSEDQDQTLADPDQPVSEEQNYRDTMQGIRSFMGWSHIPEMDSAASTSDNNPFAGPKTVAPGKVLVKMPTEDWLCRKLDKLNLTLGEGYTSFTPPASCRISQETLRRWERSEGDFSHM